LWNYVIPHFEQFLSELDLSPSDRADAESKANRVARSLFVEYYPDQVFDPACYAIVGSYGKGTAAKPRTDVDLIFVLPASEFHRINALAGNKQSQLLQEVKDTLLGTYPNTDIRGDGPVVKVPFSSYYFEVCPVFRLQDNSFINAHTKGGGRWGYTHPAQELQWIRDVDGAALGKATHLVKMLKAWKRECNVEIRSVCLEVLATVFVNQWEFRDKTIFYYDWMVRDFFAFMLGHGTGGWAKPAGISERIPFGECWQTKANSAYARALKACDYEYKDEGFAASSEWRKVFGNQFQLDWAHSLLVAGIGA
jgi:hypothetical protein